MLRLFSGGPSAGAGIEQANPDQIYNGLKNTKFCDTWVKQIAGLAIKGDFPIDDAGRFAKMQSISEQLITMLNTHRLDSEELENLGHIIEAIDKNMNAAEDIYTKITSYSAVIGAAPKTSMTTVMPLRRIDDMPVGRPSERETKRLQAVARVTEADNNAISSFGEARQKFEEARTLEDKTSRVYRAGTSASTPSTF